MTERPNSATPPEPPRPERRRTPPVGGSTPVTGILLGLSRGGAGEPATDWAAAEANRRHVPLTMIRTYRWEPGLRPWDSPVDRQITQRLRHEAEALVRHTVEHVRLRWPDVEVNGQVIEGAAGTVLTVASKDATLTVVGSRRLPVIEAVVLGSVATDVAAGAATPVIVVAGPHELPGERTAVVVGVDGREPDEATLGFAFDFASRLDLPLRPVLCWRPDALADAQWRPAQPVPEKVDRWLAEVLAGWQEKYPDVRVHRSVLRDHPVAGLVAASSGQHVLVVGSHSRHPRIGALLGSVSQGVLRHARCPVAVVPDQ